MSLAQVNKTEILQARAKMFAHVRQFFAMREVIEVDTPLLARSCPIDTHIEIVGAQVMGRRGYLHSSPEFAMKRLLAEGAGDIYQMGHVFRDFEFGAKHNPEFTMVEWYRHGFSLTELMEETFAFFQLFLDVESFEAVPIKEVFLRYAGSFPTDPEERDHLFAFKVEPHLGQGKVTFLVDFPPEQAALARTYLKNGELVALRFEGFYQGVELCNGYHELCDALEQRERLQEANRQRVELGKERYPIDQRLIEALERGLPDCAGVAVGFDRLLLLQKGAKELSEVLPFVWEE
ncbi:MAG: EF-P lysine aminoacylase GenX [Chlamydiales bacterium]